MNPKYNELWNRLNSPDGEIRMYAERLYNMPAPIYVSIPKLFHTHITGSHNKGSRVHTRQRQIDELRLCISAIDRLNALDCELSLDICILAQKPL